MLVATALTLIILLIFAQIFRSATATITLQRGTGQNDARARMMSTVIHNDLQKMTFRDHPQSTSRGLLTLGIHDLAETGYQPIHRAQAGYFYYSENDPNNDIDDVLQFTVSVTQTERNLSNYPYIGKASPIGRPGSASEYAGEYHIGANNSDQNQPEFDDGNNGNRASQSRYAEVCYFVRNGTLYRRVMLLRDPITRDFGRSYDTNPAYYEGSPPSPASPGEFPLIPGDYNSVADYNPSLPLGAGVPPPGDTPGVGDFWNDFDFSAYHDNVQLMFNGPKSLVNTGTGALLSDPRHRFGFQYRLETDPNRAQNGRPVEYVDGGSTFIGRMTHGETSDSRFLWPGTFANSPFQRSDLTLESGFVRNPSVASVYRGPRRGEDVLLPNVDAFDVQIFQQDPNVPSGANDGFVNLGHAGTGPLSAAARANDEFGPRGPLSGVVRNNVFDTWHPNNISYGRAPYRPLVNDPLDPSNPAPAPRLTWDWEPNRAYAIRNGSSPGSRIYPFAVMDVGPDGKPGQADVDDDGNGIVDDRSELGWTGSDDVAGWYDGVYYEAVEHAEGLPTGTSLGTRPAFRKRYGDKVYDGGIVWECFDNRVGVSLLQITIRYRDPASNLSRQVTIRHSLTDRSE